MDEAVALKEKGNAAYSSKQFEEASSLYSKGLESVAAGPAPSQVTSFFRVGEEAGSVKDYKVDEARVAATLLSNRSMATLAISEDTASLGFGDRIEMLQAAAADAAAVRSLRCHHEYMQSLAVSQGALSAPLLEPKVAAKSLYRYGTAMKQLSDTLEKESDALLLTATAEVDPATLKYMSSATNADLDRYAVLSEACAILEGDTLLTNELSQSRDKLFPCASFVHPSVTKLKGKGSVHGVGLGVDRGAEGLKQGDLVLREMPAIRVSDVSGMPYEKRFALAFDELLRTVKQKSKRYVGRGIVSLTHEVPPEDQQKSLDAFQFALCDIWRRNAMKIKETDFRVGEGDQGPDGVGLFVDASRFNHSCRPNCIQSFDFRTGELSVRALKDISPTEELFIAYVSPWEDPEKRRSILRFECNCELFCAGEDALDVQLEHIVCPFCSVTTSTIVEKTESETAHHCSMCRSKVPIRDYLDSVGKKAQEAVALCSSSDDPNARYRAFRMLLGIVQGATMLGPVHHKRISVMLETLASAVGLQLSLELSSEVVKITRSLLSAANELLPPRWPLATGLRMHRVMCLAGHIRRHNNGVLVTLDDECRQLIADAFDDHSVMHGDGVGALETFFKRYQTEFEVAGINSIGDFEVLLRNISEEQA